MQVELSLHRRTSAPLAARAWYAPGSDPIAWLAEAARWPVDQTQVLVIPIAGSNQSSAGGALLIPAGDDAKRVEASAPCVAYGCIGNGVYLPVDAELLPHADERELAEVFGDDALSVFLPGRGLTQVDRPQAIRLSDLLRPPAISGDNWRRAEPGVAFPTRIAALLPLDPPQLNDVLQDGRDDIGEQASDIAQLPKAPGEPMSGAAGAVQRAAVAAAAAPILGIAKAIDVLANAMKKAAGSGSSPSGDAAGTSASGSAGSGGGWTESLTKLANDMMQGVSQSLQASRNREINRLLQMLQNNPDEGLRYALPMGGDGHRGVAPPSGRLSMRDVNFRLGGHGAGGPADAWDVPYEYQQQLAARYRELASRESRLGRHRRAAYIYAELLGDLRSAASALQQGGHYREAALLYKDRLSNPRAAAECLEKGELWNEAIEAYLELGEHEKAGDLLAHIGRQEESHEAYREAANRLLEKHNYLGAARLHDEKIRDADAALELLDSAWPSTAQANRCVKAALAIRARLGRHEESIKRLDFLHERAVDLGRHADVAELLADASDQYPEDGVKQHAKQRAGQIVVARMQHSGSDELRRLARVYARIVPEDTLLLRDTQRFLDRPAARRESQPVAAAKPPENRLELIGKFRLDRGVEYHDAVLVQNRLVAVGVSGGRISVAHTTAGVGAKEGSSDPWPRVPIPSNTRLILAQETPNLHLAGTGMPPLPPSDALSLGNPGLLESPTIGTPRGVGSAWGVGAGTLGTSWYIEDRLDPALVCIDRAGVVVSSISLLRTGELDWGSVSIPVPLVATSRSVLIGVGGQLANIDGDVIEVIEQFDSPIVRLSGRDHYAAKEIGVSLERGAAIVDLGYGGATTKLADNLERPALLLGSGGLIVASDWQQTVAWRRSRHGRRRIHKLVGEHRYAQGQRHGSPVAVLQLEEIDQFVVLTFDGWVLRFAVRA